MMKNPDKIMHILIGTIIVLVLILFALFFFIITNLTQLNKQLQQVNITGNTDSNEYKFLSKRIFVDDPNDQFVNFIPLRDEINKYMQTQKTSFAVYFEYLPSGISIGVNEKEEIPLASLVKIPTVMKIYELIRDGVIKKTDTITLTEQMLDNTFGDLWKKGIGYEISVEEAINMTLTQSDNTAHNALLKFLDSSVDLAVYNTLDIRLMKEENGQYAPYGSAKSMTSVFKNLYFSSYLQPEESSEILEKLTKSTFSHQLTAGTQDTPVAHKIGVLERKNGEKFFNDCGIVYLPRRNYILCMLYQGEEEEANDHMAYVSKMIYQYLKQISSYKEEK